MKKEYKLIIILLIITIISSNFIWYKLFTSEKEKLKHAIIPSLKDDYFTNQLILSKGGNNYSIYEYEDLLDKYYSNLQYSFITKNFPLRKKNLYVYHLMPTRSMHFSEQTSRKKI